MALVFATLAIFQFTLDKLHSDKISAFLQIHLADVDVKGKLTFTESDIISPGNKPFTFEIGKNDFDLCRLHEI